MTEPAPVAPADGTGTTPDEVGWRRLPGRMLLVGPATALLRLAPALVVLVLFGAGSGNSTQVWIAGAAVVVAVAVGVVRWRTTRYRITDERVELHSGLLNRQRRSVPRDRIRTVDLTAPLLHRLVGLSVVKVGSGQSGSDAGLDLDAVTTDEAERLRRELLARPAPARGPAAVAGGLLMVFAYGQVRGQISLWRERDRAHDAEVKAARAEGKAEGATATVVRDDHPTRPD